MIQLFHVKPEQCLLVQLDGVQYKVTVASVVMHQKLPVAVTRGFIKFRLDIGIALLPVNGWIVRRLMPREVREHDAPWACGERPE